MAELASILPRLVTEHILGKGIITPELAPDDDVGLGHSLDEAHTRGRPNARAHGIERQTANLRDDLQLNRNDRAISTTNLGRMRRLR